MDDRHALLQTVGDVIETVGITGDVVDARETAASLASRYPQSGFTVDEIARIVTESAIVRGSPVYPLP
jgi:hypothetical protein